MTDPLMAQALRSMGGVPDSAIAVQGTSADLSGTTAGHVIAAPTDATKSIYVTEVVATGLTVTKPATLILQDSAGSPVVHLKLNLGDPANGVGTVRHTFNPPRKIAAGLALDAVLAASPSGASASVTASGFQG